MNSDEHKYIQELLKEIFSNVNNWLVFAETKNAAIIAFCVALLAAITSTDFFKGNTIMFSVFIAGIVLALLVALSSFAPKRGKKKESNSVPTAADNLIFFSDIAKYNKTEYIKALVKQYLKKDIRTDQIEQIELDYSEEIIYNSNLANNKYDLFKYSLDIILVMMVFLVLMIILA